MSVNVSDSELKKPRAFRAEKILKPRNALALPSEWIQEISENQIPLDLEFGCGVGFHAIRYAQLNPSRRLVAIERTREKFQSFQGRLERHPALNNLQAVHADAIAWSVHCLGGVKPSRCFFWYPNPERQNIQQRWIRSSFFGWLLEKCSNSAEFVFASNIPSYMDEVLKHGVQVWGLELVLDQTYDRQNLPQGGPRTHFEKKYLERGESCREMRLKKKR